MRKEIKKQIYNNWGEWVSKIKTIHNSYNEIVKLDDYFNYYKKENFFLQCEKILRKNLILGLKEFKNSFIYKYKSNAESDEITF